MRACLRLAAEAYEDKIRRGGVSPLRGLDIRYRCSYRTEDVADFVAAFADGDHADWHMRWSDWRIEAPDSRAETEQRIRVLFDHYAEAWLIQRELQDRRITLARHAELGAPPEELDRWRVDLDRREHHFRTFHLQPLSEMLNGAPRFPWREPARRNGTRFAAEWDQRGLPRVAGADRGGDDATAVTLRWGGYDTVTTVDLMPPSASLDPGYLDEFLASYRRNIEETFSRGLFFGAGPIGEVGSEEARAKGLALLKQWLTPEQRAQYERDQSFEVIGASGRRYRIRHGRQMNVDQLDKKGRKVAGWCFLPVGQLVAGDCMLAQKIALETDDTAALKIANKVG